MHRSFIFAIIASAAVFWGTACMAQGIPQGSYQQNCNSVSVRGDTLVANCRDSSGEWRTASLPGFQNCSSDIRNDNGNLRCEMSGYSTPSQTAGGGPTGSYLQSCQDVHAKGDDLHARCQTQNGDWKDAKLDDYNKCHGDIVNDDGRLRCVAGQSGYYRGPGPTGMPNHSNVYGPQGSYTRTCTDLRVEGDDLHARCQTTDGGWHDAKLDDYQKCQGDITNDNGHLRCVAGAPVAAPYGGPGPYAAPGASAAVNGPNGSYAQTCMNIRVEGDDLKARCQTHHGDLRDAKLDDYRKCKSDIINDDGHLRCDK